MSDHLLLPLTFTPGIQRDGPQFDASACVNGQWCRFYKSRPLKMGGYKMVQPGAKDAIIRNIKSITINNLNQIFMGTKKGITSFSLDFYLNVGDVVDVTPTNFLTSQDDAYNWSIDFINGIFKGDGGEHNSTYVIATPLSTLKDISSSESKPIYYGVVDNKSGPLVPLTSTDGNTPLTTAGGVLTVGSILFLYGNKGQVQWSTATNFNDFSSDGSGSRTLASSKIVTGMSTRGGGTAGVLFWSLNSLVRGILNPDALKNNVDPFQFDIIDDTISILSSNAVIRYNQAYYWPGIDQFYVFNGVVTSLKNTMNQLFFFNNLNYAQRQKVWGMAIPKFHELWWFFPKGDVAECNWAVIYNVEMDIWYDTPINRASGIMLSTLPYPLMSDTITQITDEDRTSSYPLWIHEKGLNKSVNGQQDAIDSYFDTPYLSFLDNPQTDKQLRIIRIEPNFDQNNTAMSVQVLKRSFPAHESGKEVEISDPYDFSQETGKIDMREMGRLINLRFRSNTLEGYYLGGKTLLHVQYGDTRP